LKLRLIIIFSYLHLLICDGICGQIFDKIEFEIHAAQKYAVSFGIDFDNNLLWYDLLEFDKGSFKKDTIKLDSKVISKIQNKLYNIKFEKIPVRTPKRKNGKMYNLVIFKNHQIIGEYATYNDLAVKHYKKAIKIITKCFTKSLSDAHIKEIIVKI